MTVTDSTPELLALHHEADAAGVPVTGIERTTSGYIRIRVASAEDAGALARHLFRDSPATASGADVYAGAWEQRDLGEGHPILTHYVIVRAGEPR